MEIKKISNDLQGYLEDISKVSSNSSINNSEKNSKLETLKKKALDSIELNAGQEIGFVAHSWIAELKTAIENESWKDIPPPENIHNQVALLDKLADTLNTLFNYVVTDFSELNRLLTQLRMDRQKIVTGQKVKSVEREFKEAAEEFKQKADAIEKQFTSASTQAWVSMGVSIGMAVCSAASVVVSIKSMKDSKTLSASGRKNLEDTQETLNGLKVNKDDQVKQASRLKAEIADKTKEIKTLKARGKDVSKAELELEGLKADRSDCLKEIKKIDAGISSARSQLKIITSEMEEETSRVQFVTQMMGMTSEFIQLTGKIIESGTKGGMTVLDKVASIAQLDAERARFRRDNERSLQDLQEKELRDIGDGISHSRDACANLSQALNDSMQRMIN